ncbi:MAG: serine hydrolase domain-containing protein [Asticcacaulis sp.]
MKPFALAFALLCLALPAHAATPDKDAAFRADLDVFLTEAMKRLETVPAVSVAVAHASGPVEMRALGYADLTRKIPATPETPFYIASATKAVVGTTFAALEQSGRINLDWTLADLASDIRFHPSIDPAKVTLRHLLTHTHGLENNALAWRLAFTGDPGPDAAWQILAHTVADPEAPLGTYRYGNVGYNIATLLIERKLGQRWQDLVEAEVLIPLGMHKTFAKGLDQHAVALPYLGAGPKGWEAGLSKTDSTLQSAGGLYSNARDMGIWLSAQLKAHAGATSALAPALRLSHAPTATLTDDFAGFKRTGYGLGWYSGTYDGAPFFHAFGSFSGFRSHTSFMPDRDLAVAVLSNDDAIGFRLTDIVAAFAYDWYGQGPAHAKARGETALAALDAQEAAFPGRVADQRAKLAARPWLLTLPKTAYAGRWCNSDYGDLTIEVAGDDMIVRMARLSGIATAFTKEDTIRVELVPNQGDVMTFKVSGKQVTGLIIKEAAFSRTCP